MEGTSNGPTSHPEMPKDVQFILDWKPPLMTARQEANPTQKPRNTHTIGYSRPAAFYDKHLAPHLILKRVICLGSIVSTMGNTVDQAIQVAVTKGAFPPKNEGVLPTAEFIQAQVVWSEWTLYHEIGVAEVYRMHTAMYCRALASTLAIHPSSREWGAALVWTADQKDARWAIADGVLRISTNVIDNGHPVQQLLEYEDAGMKTVIRQLASRGTALAIWEIKSLTVGTAQVMQEIAEMGVNHAIFPWQKCTATTVTGGHTNCTHHSWKTMEESRTNYDAGFDARSLPWTLPTFSSDPSPFAAGSQPLATPLRAGLRNAGGTTARPSYKEQSSSSMEGGEQSESGTQEQRCRKDSNASEEPPPKKSKTGLTNENDDSYEPPPGDRKEATAKSFVQQVRKCSFIQNIGPDCASRHGLMQCATIAL